MRRDKPIIKICRTDSARRRSNAHDDDGIVVGESAGREGGRGDGDLVASGRGVDCRVDQNKGLISIVDNKLAASEGGAEREREREAKGTRAVAIACNMGGG